MLSNLAQQYIRVSALPSSCMLPKCYKYHKICFFLSAIEGQGIRNELTGRRSVKQAILTSAMVAKALSCYLDRLETVGRKHETSSAIKKKKKKKPVIYAVTVTMGSSR